MPAPGLNSQPRQAVIWVVGKNMVPFLPMLKCSKAAVICEGEPEETNPAHPKAWHASYSGEGFLKARHVDVPVTTDFVSQGIKPMKNLLMGKLQYA